MIHYAHSLPDRDPAEWQPLRDHLEAVAEQAERFAASFGGGPWARLAGLWHDLGKYDPAFQAMLLSANGLDAHMESGPARVVHSDAGAHCAKLKNWPALDLVLGWLIAGHHAGLADRFVGEETGSSALDERMRDPERSTPVLERVPPDLLDQPRPEHRLRPGVDLALYIRMLFSCLVDADFLDTEAFMDRSRAERRRRVFPDMATLHAALDRHLEALSAGATASLVNQVRREVLAAARARAAAEQGVYSMTVPTGGGKTLSSLAFALAHARRHELQRVIYVIPFTSIIEQTASTFRGIRGFEEAVLEHHSQVVDDGPDRETWWSRLAAENWDAPLVVTTSVQFFESLHASRPSRCRKLHNIVNSVIVLDEAQCLPPAFLRPCVHALRELVQTYGCTVLLTTATQPALNKTRSFDFNFREGFDEVHELVPDPEGLAARMRRTTVRLVDRGLEPLSMDDVATRLRQCEGSALCVVNRRDDCRALAQALDRSDVFHLSTCMCAEHREKVLAEVRRRLQADEKTVLVATSLIEAGVDIDFPVVFRALAGLDSVAQAAGRCNREGRHEGLAPVYVFVPERQPAYVRPAADITRGLFDEDGVLDIHSPGAFTAYFSQRFWRLGEERLDAQGIRRLLAPSLEHAFRTAASRFRLIQDDWQLPVIVPYGPAQELVDHLVRDFGDARRTLRRLQRYTVQLDARLHAALVAHDYIRPVADVPNLYVCSDRIYSDRYGLAPPEADTQATAEALFI